VSDGSHDVLAVSAGIGGLTAALAARGGHDALSHRMGRPGLFMCGDTVFPGQGTIGVTLSGINAWRSATACAMDGDSLVVVGR
jgi:hypothetical protein